MSTATSRPGYSYGNVSSAAVSIASDPRISNRRSGTGGVSTIRAMSHPSAHSIPSPSATRAGDLSCPERTRQSHGANNANAAITFVRDLLTTGGPHSYDEFVHWQWRCWMTYIIAEPCINTKDRSCVEVCPVDCIYEYVEEVGAFVVPDPSTGAGVDKQVIPRGEATH